MEESKYQNEQREIALGLARLLAYTATSGISGYVDGSLIPLKSDTVLSAVATAGNDFVVGSVGLLVAAGTITLADADAAATTNGLLVMSLAATDAGETGLFQMPPGVKITSTAHGFTVGAPLYVSATAGELTASAPGSGDFQRVVAVAIDANTLYWMGHSSAANAV